MSTGFGIRKPGTGSSAAGLDLRALNQLGIKRFATDSRRVKRGNTFIAYPGESQDGRSYIAQAIDNGAESVLWERRGFEWKRAWRRPNARRGDIVLIAGKGHETYQEVKGVKRPFSDIAVARAALRGWDS